MPGLPSFPASDRANDGNDGIDGGLGRDGVTGGNSIDDFNDGPDSFVVQASCLLFWSSRSGRLEACTTITTRRG
jgi:hypothetical protein